MTSNELRSAPAPLRPRRLPWAILVAALALAAIGAPMLAPRAVLAQGGFPGGDMPGGFDHEQRPEPRRPAEPERPFVETATGDAAEAQALFEEAEQHFEDGALYEAQRLYRRIILRHPGFDAIATVIDRQLEIGMTFLEGEATRPFLFFFRRRAPGLGVEILEELLERFEQARFDFARYRIAEHYFEAGRYEQAAKQYQRVEEDFPDSVWMGAARYQRAICYLRLQRGHSYDDQSARRAEALLLDYLRRYPTGDRVDDAEAALAEIRGDRARLYHEIAQSYLRRERSPAAALIYAEAILREAPESQAAAELPELLAGIEAHRQADPAAAEAARALRERLERRERGRVDGDTDVDAGAGAGAESQRR